MSFKDHKVLINIKIKTQHYSFGSLKKCKIK